MQIFYKFFFTHKFIDLFINLYLKYTWKILPRKIYVFTTWKYWNERNRFNLHLKCEIYLFFCIGFQTMFLFLFYVLFMVMIAFESSSWYFIFSCPFFHPFFYFMLFLCMWNLWHIFEWFLKQFFGWKEEFKKL